MRRMLKTLGRLGLAVLTAAVFLPGSAKAADSSVVPVVPCFDNGGTATVTAGAPITLHLGGYAEGTAGLMQVVLRAQTTTLEVTGPAGDTTYNLSSQWSAPTQLGMGLYVIRQPDLTLPSLQPGQSVTVVYDIAFSHPVAVLYPPVGPTGDNGPYLIKGEGPITCQITASA